MSYLVNYKEIPRYENQILQNQTELKFVNWFPENQFFIKTTIKSPDIAPDFLINTIEHYQSISQLTNLQKECKSL